MHKLKKILRKQVVQEGVKITVPNSVLILAMAGALAVAELAVSKVVEKIAIGIASRVAKILVKAQVERIRVTVAHIHVEKIAMAIVTKDVLVNVVLIALDNVNQLV